MDLYLLFPICLHGIDRHNCDMFTGKHVSVLPKLLLKQCYIVLEYLLPSTKFFNFMFIWSINRPVAVVSTFNSKSRKKDCFLVIISCFLYCVCVLLLFYGFKVVPEEQGCAPCQCQASVMTYDFWCVISECEFHSVCYFLNQLQINLARSSTNILISFGN